MLWMTAVVFEGGQFAQNQTDARGWHYQHMNAGVGVVHDVKALETRGDNALGLLF